MATIRKKSRRGVKTRKRKTFRKKSRKMKRKPKRKSKRVKTRKQRGGWDLFWSSKAAARRAAEEAAAKAAEEAAKAAEEAAAKAAEEAAKAAEEAAARRAANDLFKEYYDSMTNLNNKRDVEKERQEQKLEKKKELNRMNRMKRTRQQEAAAAAAAAAGGDGDDFTIDSSTTPLNAATFIVKEYATIAKEWEQQANEQPVPIIEGGNIKGYNQETEKFIIGDEIGDKEKKTFSITETALKDVLERLGNSQKHGTKTKALENGVDMNSRLYYILNS